MEGAPRRKRWEEAERRPAAEEQLPVAGVKANARWSGDRHAVEQERGGTLEQADGGGGEVTMVQLRPSPCSQSLSSHAPLPRLSCSAARRGRRLGRRACSRGTGVHRASPFHPPGDPVVIARLVPNFRRFSPSSLTSMTFGGQCRREIEREDRER